MRNWSSFGAKPFIKFQQIALSCVAGVAIMFFGPAQAQSDWPGGPITVIAPFSPGGGGDTLARLYANEISKSLGVTIVVENKPGAGGNIGTTAASRATPDGNTLAYGTNGTMGTNHALYNRPGYSISDFEPIALFGKISLVFTVSTDSSFHSVEDLIAEAKKNPDMLTCASGGNGTTSHLACAMFQKLAGIKVQHVPYRSSSAALVDMMSGRISFLIDVMPFLAPQIKDGKVRALAVTMTERVPALPEVPTMTEAGVDGYDLFAWDGIFALAGTPPARLDKLHAAVESVLNDQAFQGVMAARGAILETMSREAFTDFVKKEHDRMGALVRELGIQIG